MKSPEKIAALTKEYLLTRKEDMILFLNELVNIESPSDKINSQHQILGYLRDRFTAMGYLAIHMYGKN
ncbi:MAG: M20 family peptidase, partial [Eudoraea sp.]